MTVQLAQKILLEKFKKEPFHNLYLLKNIEPNTTIYGGTCSDKTLGYLQAAKVAGIDAYLHSARIGDKDIHRLIRLEIDGKRYFADPGNGWPSIKLIPTDIPIKYQCYGMCYRTEIKNGVITVFHQKNLIEKEQMEIDIAEKSNSEICKEITNRFSTGIVYPFSNQLRFSMIVDENFLFIRDEKIEVYEEGGGYKEINNITCDNLKRITLEYFNYDLGPLLNLVQAK